MITYCVMLDVPEDLVVFVTRLLREERRRSGTRRGPRKLTCRKQALFVLACFRDRTDIPRLGSGFDLSRATSYRYHNERIRVLALQAPDLPSAIERTRTNSLTHLILDGKVVNTDRLREKKISRNGTEIDSWYASKTHDFGRNN